jgi:signal transduction histidine kinase/CheY-like chemotaxis protein
MGSQPPSHRPPALHLHPADGHAAIRTRGLADHWVVEEPKSRVERTLAEPVEGAAFGICIVDSEFRIVHMNAGSQNGTFQNVRAVLGRDFAEAMRMLWPEPVVAQMASMFQHTLETGEPYYSASRTSPRRDVGTVESHEWQLHRMTLPDGQHGVICYYIDSTRLHGVEEELHGAHDSLEATVRERTAELTRTNEQLRQEIQERVRSEHARRLEEARLEALYRLSQLADAPVEQVCGFILEQAIVLTASRIGFVGFLSDDESVYTLHAVSKDVVKECDVSGNPMHWPVNDAGLWAEAIRTRRTLVVNDYGLPHRSKKGLPPGHPRMQRFMVVPVLDGKKIVAVAGVGNKGSDYEPADERQLALLLHGMWKHVQGVRDRRALREAHDDLERKVSDRTAELFASNLALQAEVARRQRVEEALTQANERLREADRRKNEFLAVLSHELRNPLAPITSSLYVLEHAPPNGAQANRARRVVGRQVRQLSHLVNDLLDVTRITSNKIRLHKERLELNEVVRCAVEDNRSCFERSGVGLDLVPWPRRIPVLADGARIAQVIGNLLQNAVKFTGEGGLTRVSVAAEAGEAVVRVADNGLGMGSETLGRLFHPFMQASQTLDRSQGGLGLGLALVKGLVELHGGSVAAHSDGPGTGCELVVRLPLGTVTALEPTAAQPSSERARRRILIIEDNVDAADSLREALECDGHEVAVAYDGPQGLAKAGEFDPEVVLCDIGLPGMDGFDVARALRSAGQLQGSFLVALSGYASPEDLRRAAEAGFERHLAKPPSIEELEAVLADARVRPNRARTAR